LLVRFHRPIPKRVGRIESLAISILAALVLASAGVPSIAAVAASDPSPSPAPSASPVASASASASPSASPAPGASPAPSASPSPSASASQPADPSPSGSVDPTVPVSPGPSVAAAVLRPTPTLTPPPGAVAAFAVKGQPYSLPAFVGLGSWQVSSVSFYGPGFYCVLNHVKDCLPQRGGSAWPNGTACGVMYTRTLVGVANRTLPCGTLVAFSYGGHTVIAPVVDRGPYVTGRNWDLSGGLCRALHHCFTGPIRWTIVHRAVGPALPLRISLRRL
jgi:Lytic transglycolase